MNIFTKSCLFIFGSLAVYGQTFEEKVIAAVIYGEAANQGKIGMSAVAEVIHQRAAETGKSPLQVVVQGKLKHRAFSCLNGLSPTELVRRAAGKAGFNETALPLAIQVVRLPQALTHWTKRATHFTRKEEKPWWAKGYNPVAIIGDHAFYRLPWIL